MLKRSSLLSHTLLSLLSASVSTTYAEPEREFVKGEFQKVALPDLKVDEGLEVTVWASSPLLFNPTNMDVDQSGRIWVTEGVNYRRRQRRQEGDRIVVLEDSNGDGEADSSHTFYQSPELQSPLGIAVFDNRIIVSQPPSLIVLTDVDRNLKFDPEVDTREVLLTGFNAIQHDHSLHSVTSGPDGKLYFNNGNCGAEFTDKSGKTFRIGSPYYKSGGGTWPIDTSLIAGQTSDDGHVWAPGFTVRMNPDGSDVEIIGQGYRNSYENINDSFGNLFQNDNDDPPACRNSYVLEYGSAGYFSEDSKRFWHSDYRRDQLHASAHWRQDDPDTFDAGDIYGGGSPTGVAFYENGAFPEAFNGTFLSCEAGKNVIFSYQPEAKGAGFKMERNDFITSNPSGDYAGSDFAIKGVEITEDGDRKEITKGQPIKKGGGEVDSRLFRPSDALVGPDGAIYVCDWFDGRVGGHGTLDDSCSGTIYRIAPKGFKPSVPKIDLSNTEGQIAALSSPANNVRFLGFSALKEAGERSLEPVLKLTEHSNKWIAARAIWLLPHLGTQGMAATEALLESEDWEVRLVAYRALRRVTQDISPYAKKMADDSSAAVRRDVALSLRHLSADQTASIFVTLAKHLDPFDKNAMLAIRIGSAGKRDATWLALRDAMATGAAKDWSREFVRITWSLGARSAIESLRERATTDSLSFEDRAFAIESLAFTKDQAAADAMFALCQAESDIQGEASYWFTRLAFGAWEDLDLLTELEELGLYDPNSKGTVPAPLPEPTEPPKFSVADLAPLTGDPSRGKTTAMRCIMCHEIDGQGVAYGPDLRGWLSRQSDEAFYASIITPSKDIAHGYEGHRIILKEGGAIDGKMSRFGNPSIITSMGGIKQIVPRKLIKKTSKLDRSLMLSADQMGLSAQDIADLAAYLKTY